MKSSSLLQTNASREETPASSSDGRAEGRCLQQAQLHPISCPLKGQNEPAERDKLPAKSPWKDFASHLEQRDVYSLLCVEAVVGLGREKQHVLLGMEKSGVIVNPKYLRTCPHVHTCPHPSALLYVLGQSRVPQRIFCCSQEDIGRTVSDFQTFLPSMASGRQAGLCCCLDGEPQARLETVIHSVFIVKTSVSVPRMGPFPC